MYDGFPFLEHDDFRMIVQICSIGSIVKVTREKRA